VRNRGRVTRIHKVIVLKSGTRREQRAPVGITPTDYPFADISAANVIRNRIPDAFIPLLSRLDGFLFNLRIRLTTMTVMTMRDATLQISSFASPPLSSSRCRYPNAFDYYHHGATSMISCFPYVRSFASGKLIFSCMRFIPRASLDNSRKGGALNLALRSASNVTTAV